MFLQPSDNGGYARDERMTERHKETEEQRALHLGKDF
jgi:hypothetical protein